MATFRTIALLIGAALIVAACLLSDAANPDLNRPSSVRLGLAGAGTVIAIGALLMRMPVRKDDGAVGNGSATN